MKLGIKVKDSINGIEGIATAKSISINGAIQYCVKPKSLNVNGIPKESFWLDKQYVERIGKSYLKPLKLSYTNIKLGDYVTHVNGFKGIAVERLEYLNGCVYFYVLPLSKDQNVFPEREFIACQFLKVDTDREKIVIEEDPNGGPPSSAPTM